MLDYLRKLVLQKYDSLNIQENADICKNLDKDGTPTTLQETVLFSLNAVKINQRNWKQTRSIVITTKGFYNLNGKSIRRFVEPSKIHGIIYSSKSYEVVIHIPSEYDFHYVISEQMEKMMYFIYVCKQLNSKQEIDLTLIKTDIEFLAPYAVKETQPMENPFKRMEGVPQQKEVRPLDARATRFESSSRSSRTGFADTSKSFLRFTIPTSAKRATTGRESLSSERSALLAY